MVPVFLPPEVRISMVEWYNRFFYILSPVSPNTHASDFSMISLKQFHMPSLTSLCLDRFGEGTSVTLSSSVFISDSLEFNASKVLIFVSFLEKLVFKMWIKEHCYR